MRRPLLGQGLGTRQTGTTIPSATRRSSTTSGSGTFLDVGLVGIVGWLWLIVRSFAGSVVSLGRGEAPKACSRRLSPHPSRASPSRCSRTTRSRSSRRRSCSGCSWRSVPRSIAVHPETEALPRSRRSEVHLGHRSPPAGRRADGASRMNDSVRGICFHGIGNPRRAARPGRGPLLDLGRRRSTGSWTPSRGGPTFGSASTTATHRTSRSALGALLERRLVGSFFVVAGRIGSPGSLDEDGLRELRSTWHDDRHARDGSSSVATASARRSASVS